MGTNAASWLSRTKVTLPRFARAAFDEVAPLRPRKVLAELAATLLPTQSFNRTRTAMLRAAGVRIGQHSLLLGPISITGNDNPCDFLSIGERTLISGPFRVDLGACVKIGNSVQIGHDVTFLTVSHDIGSASLRAGTRHYAPIEVGDGVWIASRVTVLPGVVIGRGAVVAAGSVVSRDVLPNTLVAGVPARVIRTLSEDGDESASGPCSRRRRLQNALDGGSVNPAPNAADRATDRSYSHQ
jgi:maltose O-acetyltransferase